MRDLSYVSTTTITQGLKSLSSLLFVVALAQIASISDFEAFAVGLSTHLFVGAIASAWVNQVVELTASPYEVNPCSTEFRSGFGTTLALSTMTAVVCFASISLLTGINLLPWIFITPIMSVEGFVTDYLISRGGSKISLWINGGRLAVFCGAESILRWISLESPHPRLVAWGLPAVGVAAYYWRACDYTIAVDLRGWFSRGGRELVSLSLFSFGLLQVSAVFLSTLVQRDAAASLVIANSVYGPLGLLKASISKVLVSRVRTGVMPALAFDMYRKCLIVINLIAPAIVASLSFVLDDVLAQVFRSGWSTYQAIIVGFAALQVSTGMAGIYSLSLRARGDSRALQNFGMMSGIGTYSTLCVASCVVSFNVALICASAINLIVLVTVVVLCEVLGHRSRDDGEGERDLGGFAIKPSHQGVTERQI